MNKESVVMLKNCVNINFQHDSQEFISFVLNIIHDFVNLCQPHQSVLEDVSKRLKMDSSEEETSEEQKAEKAWE